MPWILWLEECTPRQAFRSGYLLGLFFFGGTIWWLVHVTLPGALFLIAYLALYFAAWGWLAQRILARSHPVYALLLLPSSWVVLEYMRSHFGSGLGWNLLAHTQWNWLPLIQIAGVTGVWGVSFLIVLFNLAVCRALRGRAGRAPLLIAGICVLAASLYGRGVINRLDQNSSSASFRPALLQGNIPQQEKWDEAFQEAIWKRYEELAVEAVKLKPDLIVWPETSAPGFLEELTVRHRLDSIVRSAGIPTLVGLPTENKEKELPYNSAVLFRPDGEEEARYSKIHLVPFGEYIPFRGIFGWLKKYYPVADFAPGEEFTVFPFPSPSLSPRGGEGQGEGGFSVLICFEDLFPELGRQFVREGARCLFVITNDAWFGRSAASIQHLQASVFRAVENQVWVGRAANTGWTGFVDPAGRRLPPPAQLPLFKPGVAVADLQIPSAAGTPYTRWGDWFPVFCLLLTAFGIMKSSHGNTRSA